MTKISLKNGRRALGIFRDVLLGLPVPKRKTPTASQLISLIKSKAPVILEIGCNDGTDTVQFASALPHATIYGFEPDERAASKFIKNTAQFPNVHLFQVAIAAIDGEADFFKSNSVNGEWDQSGSILTPLNHLNVFPWVTFDKRERVRTVNLDTWSAKYCPGRIDFIWMDVQGAEGEIFRSSPKTFARTSYIYTEYDDRELYKGQVPLRELLKLVPDFVIAERYLNDVLLRNQDLVGGR